MTPHLACRRLRRWRSDRVGRGDSVGPGADPADGSRGHGGSDGGAWVGVGAHALLGAASGSRTGVSVQVVTETMTKGYRVVVPG